MVSVTLADAGTANRPRRGSAWLGSVRDGYRSATIPLIFLIAFFIVPVLLLLLISFFKASSFVIEPTLNIDNYVRILSAKGFWLATWVGFKNGLFTAIACVVLSFPVAFYIVYRSRSNLVLYLVLLSWFSSYLVRIYAWRTILGTNGLINSSLINLGLIDRPLEIILFSPFASVVTLVHIMLPFALLILVSAMRDVKQEYLEAALDLGATKVQVLYKVILPMIYKGLMGSFMFTFILSAGDYVIPQVLGGRDGITSGLLIANQFRSAGNWPLGAAMAFVLMLTFMATYVTFILLLRLARIVPGRRYHM